MLNLYIEPIGPEVDDFEVIESAPLPRSVV